MGDMLARFGGRIGRKVRSIMPLMVGSIVLVLLLSLVLTAIQGYLPADAQNILSRLQAGDLAEARSLLHSSIGQSGAWQYGAFLALQILQVVFAPIPS